MRKFRKVLLWAVGIGAIAVLVAAVAFTFLFDVNRLKPSLEAAASKSLGMRLEVRGDASLRLFPSVHAVLRDIHLSEGAVEVLSARAVEVSPRIMPYLLHREISVRRVDIVSPRVQVEVPRPVRHEQASREKSSGSLKVGTVTIRDGSATYHDRKSGQKVDVNGLDVELKEIQVEPGAISGQGKVKIAKIESRSGPSGRKIELTDLKSNFRDDRGHLLFDPTEFSAFGGQVKGSAKVDLTGATPRFELAQAATRIDLSQLMAPDQAVTLSGTGQGSVQLSARGLDSTSILRSATGEVSVRNDGPITVHHLDLDKVLATYESAEAGNVPQLGGDLAGLGASFFSGKIAPKGSESAGDSRIDKLTSTWKIAGGGAEAQDVAFATGKYVVAFKGGLDLVDQKFRHFFVSTVDSRGCAVAKQEIAGSVSDPKPVMSAPDVAGMLEGALGAALPKRQAGKACEIFYSGSVSHP